MGSENLIPWRWFRTTRATARRPARASLIASASSETLESRCLLSASRGHGGGQLVDVAPDANLQQDRPSAGRAAKKAVFPNMAGTWEMITHSEGLDIHGTLVLQQKGKKVTGTLTNDLQPPGNVKFKLTLPKATLATTIGRGINGVVSSEPSDLEGNVEDNNPGQDSDGDGNPNNDTNTWHGMWTTRDDIEISDQFDALHTVFDD